MNLRMSGSEKSIPNLFAIWILAFTLANSGCRKEVVETPYGGRGSLKVGDPAPPVIVADWFQGEDPGKFESGKVYVVEFWATWCGPCLLNMPHMSNLQQQYRSEAIFIGVTDESKQKVEAFLASESSSGMTWAQQITYRLATDRDGNMHRNYMAAANQMGIPTAFIVGKTGSIEWIGHPADLDAPLADAVASDS